METGREGTAGNGGASRSWKGGLLWVLIQHNQPHTIMSYVNQPELEEIEHGGIHAYQF